MKRPVLLALALAATLPLLGEEAKKPQAPTTPQTTTAEDSPLVRAAKSANRLGRKRGHVITNETLKTSKGHVTTTTVQRPVDIPEPEPRRSEVEAAAAAKKRADDARVRATADAAARKSAEERERTMAAAAEAAEQGLYDSMDVDPAAAEHAAAQAAEQKEKKPPQH